MVNNSSISFLGKHLPYWVVIGGLIVWIIFLKQDDRNSAFFKDLNVTLNDTEGFLSGFNGVTYAQIDRNLRSYSTPANADLHRMASGVEELSWSTYRFFDSYSDSISNHSFQSDKMSSEVYEKINSFKDSLFLFTDNDSSLNNSLSAFLKPGIGEEKFIKRASLGGYLLWLKYWNLKATLAISTALHYLFKKSPSLGTQCWGSDIIMSTAAVAPKKNELFEAAFYITDYERIGIDQTAKINGVRYDIEEGLVSFQHKYAQPGKKSIEVEFEWTDFISGEKRSMKKAFEVNVFEPCFK